MSRGNTTEHYTVLVVWLQLDHFTLQE